MIVYKCINLITKRIYVGASRNSLHIRRGRHLTEARRGNPLPFYEALREFGFDKFKWVVVFESDNLSEIAEKEKELIKIAKTSTQGCYNLSDGGDNFGTNGLTQDIKNKISKALKGRECNENSRQGVINYNKTRPITSEMRKNMSEAHKKLSETKEGKEHLQKITELAKKRFKKPFKVYCEGEEIGKWFLLRECARALALDHSSISKCLRGEHKTHKGYTFKYI